MSKEWSETPVNLPTEEYEAVKQMFPETVKFQERMEALDNEHKALFNQVYERMLQANPLDPAFQKILDDNLLDLF